MVVSGRARWPSGTGQRLRLIAIGVGVAALLGAASGSATVARRTSAAAASTVSIPLPVGERPLYIFPLAPGADFIFANDQLFQYLMYKPLFWYGDNGKAVVNYKLSIANQPVFSDHNRRVTISLKPYAWSDGAPLTTRDIRFWMDLLVANRADWGDYTPTEFPDNVAGIQWTSSRQFTITFNRSYSPTWILYNELSQIYPIPQHAWDKTSSSGAVGNYDETPAGAIAVYKYLNSQSLQEATYDTNPLWQVVDGPWRIETGTGFEPATGYTTFARNPRYSGPDTPHLAHLSEVPFTSDTAEFDALRAGTIQAGGIPITDINQIRFFRSRGFHVQPWYIFGWSWIGLNFTNPQVGPILRELYVRQALQRTIDQTSWVRDILKGYGKPQYSPIPTVVPNPFVDAFVQRNPDPYSIAGAAALLRNHGWRVVPNGTSTCLHPGTGATQCGAGIGGGASLTLHLQYAAGDTSLTEEVEAFKSAAAQAGITIELAEQPIDSVFAEYAPCASGKPCPWQMLDVGIAANYVYYPDYYPSGEPYYLPHAAFNGGGYSDPTATRLILATLEQPGRAPFVRYENYIATHLPTLWTPSAAYSINVFSPHLHNVPPADPFGAIYPQDWTMGG